MAMVMGVIMGILAMLIMEGMLALVNMEVIPAMLNMEGMLTLINMEVIRNNRHFTPSDSRVFNMVDSCWSWIQERKKGDSNKV